jgi:hypothetical protein
MTAGRRVGSSDKAPEWRAKQFVPLTRDSKCRQRGGLGRTIRRARHFERADPALTMRIAWCGKGSLPHLLERATAIRLNASRAAPPCSRRSVVGVGGLCTWDSCNRLERRTRASTRSVSVSTKVTMQDDRQQLTLGLDDRGESPDERRRRSNRRRQMALRRRRQSVPPQIEAPDGPCAGFVRVDAWGNRKLESQERRPIDTRVEHGTPSAGAPVSQTGDPFGTA